MSKPGYRYWMGKVTEEAAAEAIVDVLALQLDEVRKRAFHERGTLDGLDTVILPPDGHARHSKERVMQRLWTVAITENPTDLARRLSGTVQGYGFPGGRSEDGMKRRVVCVDRLSLWERLVVRLTGYSVFRVEDANGRRSWWRPEP